MFVFYDQLLKKFSKLKAKSKFQNESQYKSLKKLIKSRKHDLIVNNLRENFHSIQRSYENITSLDKYTHLWLITNFFFFLILFYSSDNTFKNIVIVKFWSSRISIVFKMFLSNYIYYNNPKIS